MVPVTGLLASILATSGRACTAQQAMRDRAVRNVPERSVVSSGTFHQHFPGPRSSRTIPLMPHSSPRNEQKFPLPSPLHRRALGSDPLAPHRVAISTVKSGEVLLLQTNQILEDALLTSHCPRPFAREATIDRPLWRYITSKLPAGWTKTK